MQMGWRGSVGNEGLPRATSAVNRWSLSEHYLGSAMPRARLPKLRRSAFNTEPEISGAIDHHDKPGLLEPAGIDQTASVYAYTNVVRPRGYGKVSGSR